MTRVMLALLLLFTGSAYAATSKGCRTADGGWSEAAYPKAYIDAQKTAAAERAAADDFIRNGQVTVGMTAWQAIKLGNPTRINSTETVNGTNEQWVYPCKNVYFEHNVVVAIQETGCN